MICRGFGRGLFGVRLAGGGPTGPALGIDLARRSSGVRAADEADRFSGRPRAIQPRRLEVFDDLGVVDAVLSERRGPVPLRVSLDGNLAGKRTKHATVD